MSHIAELHDRASCKTPFSGNQNGIGWSTNTNRSANPVLFCKFLLRKSPRGRWCRLGSGIGFEDDAITEAFETTFEVGDGSGVADLVEIGFAEIAIGQVLSEHVIGGDENFMGDGERGAQAAAAGFEAVELVLEVAALGSRGGDRGADQDRAQVDIALSGAAALLPAGALMVAGTDARPGGQMIDAQEYAHVDA